MLFNWFDSQTATRAPIEDVTRATALTEALVCEAHHAALMTATLTSGINALTDRVLHIGPAQLEPFVPGDMSSTHNLLKLLVDTNPALDETIFLEQYIDATVLGKQLLNIYLTDATTLGSGHAAVVHKRILGESWRNTCHLASLAIKELDALIAPDLPEVYVQNSRVLSALLSGAINGWRPCIDGNGNLYLPPLPQQRRWPRRALLQSCRVAKRGFKFDAFARDVSAGGLGLDQMPPVERGDQLTIELMCGRALKGLVAWSEGAKAGLRFTTELRPEDPLLLV